MSRNGNAGLFLKFKSCLAWQRQILYNRTWNCAGACLKGCQLHAFRNRFIEDTKRGVRSWLNCWKAARIWFTERRSLHRAQRRRPRLRVRQDGKYPGRRRPGIRWLTVFLRRTILPETWTGLRSDLIN